jgi:hypothetical protein
MMILAYILSGLSLLMGVLFLVGLENLTIRTLLWFPKLTAGAFSPYWAIMGVVGALIG